MIDSSNPNSLMGADVIDADGAKIGSVGQVYIDTDTETPTWVSVRTGLFGMSETFVPIDQAELNGTDLRVPYTKDFVKDAPRIDVDGALENSQEDELYAYYGNAARGTGQGSDTTATGAGAGTVGYDTSGPSTDTAMTRSEERLNVGTEKVQTGRARLRKYVVTHNETVTVPVSHEEVRIEREPITDANVGDPVSGPDISEEEHEVVLTEERPVVQKETVPVERVRLDKETVTENETVSGEVRKEEIEYDDGSHRTDRT